MLAVEQRSRLAKPRQQFVVQQRIELRLVQPCLLEDVHAPAFQGQRFRKRHAVDAAGGRSGDDVNDKARSDRVFVELVGVNLGPAPGFTSRPRFKNLAQSHDRLARCP